MAYIDKSILVSGKGKTILDGEDVTLHYQIVGDEGIVQASSKETGCSVIRLSSNYIGTQLYSVLIGLKEGDIHKYTCLWKDEQEQAQLSGILESQGYNYKLEEEIIRLYREHYSCPRPYFSAHGDQGRQFWQYVVRKLPELEWEEVQQLDLSKYMAMDLAMGSTETGRRYYGSHVSDADVLGFDFGCSFDYDSDRYTAFRSTKQKEQRLQKAKDAGYIRHTSSWAQLCGEQPVQKQLAVTVQIVRAGLLTKVDEDGDIQRESCLLECTLDSPTENIMHEQTEEEIFVKQASTKYHTKVYGKQPEQGVGRNAFLSIPEPPVSPLRPMPGSLCYVDWAIVEQTHTYDIDTLTSTIPRILSSSPSYFCNIDPSLRGKCACAYRVIVDTEKEPSQPRSLCPYTPTVHLQPQNSDPQLFLQYLFQCKVTEQSKEYVFLHEQYLQMQEEYQSVRDRVENALKQQNAPDVTEIVHNIRNQNLPFMSPFPVRSFQSLDTHYSGNVQYSSVKSLIQQEVQLQGIVHAYSGVFEKQDIVHPLQDLKCLPSGSSILRNTVLPPPPMAVHELLTHQSAGEECRALVQRNMLFGGLLQPLPVYFRQMVCNTSTIPYGRLGGVSDLTVYPERVMLYMKLHTFTLPPAIDHVIRVRKVQDVIGLGNSTLRLGNVFITLAEHFYKHALVLMPYGRSRKDMKASTSNTMDIIVLDDQMEQYEEIEREVWTPLRVVCYSHLSMCLQKKGLLDEAMEQLKELLRWDEGNIKSLYRLSAYYIQKQNLDEANLYLEKLVAIQDDQYVQQQQQKYTQARQKEEERWFKGTNLLSTSHK